MCNPKSKVIRIVASIDDPLAMRMVQHLDGSQPIIQSTDDPLKRDTGLPIKYLRTVEKVSSSPRPTSTSTVIIENIDTGKCFQLELQTISGNALAFCNISDWCISSQNLLGDKHYFSMNPERIRAWDKRLDMFCSLTKRCTLNKSEQLDQNRVVRMATNEFLSFLFREEKNQVAFVREPVTRGHKGKSRTRVLNVAWSID